MNRISKYFLCMFLISFFSILNVKAECTYKDRKELLNQSKNIEAYFEPKVDLNKFVFYMYNLTDDIIVKIKMANDMVIDEVNSYDYDEFYTFEVANTDDVVTYTLEFYANSGECFGNKLMSKKVKRGIINKFAKENVCEGIEEYQYCKSVLDKKITLEDKDVYANIFEYKQSLIKKVEEKEKFDFIKFLKNYKYYFIGVGVVALGIIIYIYIDKKRGEL